MALLSFQAHCKLRCAIGVVAGLQLLLVPESFAHTFGMTCVAPSHLHVSSLGSETCASGGSLHRQA